jgi:hypothetical protein
VRTEFVSKLGMLYEDGGHFALCVNEAVTVSIDGIGMLPSLEMVETMVVRTDESGLGGGMPLVVAAVEGV